MSRCISSAGLRRLVFGFASRISKQIKASARCALGSALTFRKNHLIWVGGQGAVSRTKYYFIRATLLWI